MNKQHQPSGETRMFKIGEFSKVGLVSIKTLRHYDDMGLLQPAYTDPDSGYRYYIPEQLPRLNKILALKELGFSLSQVKAMLDDNISLEDMRTMLDKRRHEIKQQIEDEMLKLSWVEAKLDFIEREGKIPNAEARLKSQPGFHALCIREPAAGMTNWIPLVEETYQALRKHGFGDTTACLALFHGQEFDEQMVDWELAFPVEEDSKAVVPLSRGRQLVLRAIPDVETMASLVHRGSFATLSEGYSTLAHWIRHNGYTICGPAREVYIKIGFREGQRDDNITEIQFPVET